jgi:cytochrome c peroxidase
VLDESAGGLNTLYAGYAATHASVMESMHLELIRIMSLYITGYDAPDLKTGVLESGTALESMRYIAGILFQPANAETILFDSLIAQTIQYTSSTDFDHLNRLIFLTQYSLPLKAAQRCSNSFDGNYLKFRTIIRIICSRVNSSIRKISSSK